MKWLLPCLAVMMWLCSPLPPAFAWEGFDAATADLVEITPDRIPSRGETIEVRNYDKNTTETCLVESVIRNARTIEIVARTPGGEQKRLVMEGR